MENDKINSLTNLFQYLLSAGILSEWKIEFALPYLVMNSAVEISFDQVVGHLIIHCMSLMVHKVGAEWRNFANLTCSDCSKLLSQTPSKIFLSSVTASN